MITTMMVALAMGQTAPQPFSADGVCTAGQAQSCACTTQLGQSVPGQQRCTDAGEWAACGCPEEWPYLGPTCQQTRCTPLEPGAGGYDGEHCCTDTGACGLSSAEAFGTRPLCLEIGSNPLGIPDPDTCGLQIPFVETVSCCRPDNQCGLRLAYANWDRVGCIERTEFKSYLERNILLRIFLAFSEFSLDEITAQSCRFDD